MEVDEKFINVYLNELGLWSAALCESDSKLDSLGGAYPKSRPASIDASKKWGRTLPIKTSYGPLFISDNVKERVSTFLREGVAGRIIAEKFNISLRSVSDIKEGIDIEDKPILRY